MEPPVSTDADVLRVVLNSTDEGIILLRAIRNQEQQITDFAYRHYNTQALMFLRKEASAIDGRTLLEVFPNNPETGLFSAFCQAVDQQHPLRQEQSCDHDGLRHWYSMKASATGDDLLVTFRDVSEHKRTLIEKNRIENLYDVLINTLPGIDVALINRDLSVEVTKGAPFAAFGHPQRINPGQVLFRDIPHGTSEKVEPLYQKALRGQAMKVEITTDDGLYQVNLVPARNQERVFGVLLVSMDIGIFNASEDDLRNKLYVLESTKESLEQFAYVASHDLQEPLRKIRAFGDRLTTKYSDQLAGSGQDYIARMQNAATRMQHLIDDLLQYSRVGRIQGEAQAANLTELVAEVMEDISDSVEKSQAEVSYQGLPTVEGEVWQLRQLFQNLISNAIKFRRPDVPPQVAVTAREIPSDELVHLRQNHLIDTPYYEISVADNGIGFDEKYLDRIFDIFQRLHGRNEYSGTGIGLAICRKITENHYGTISAYACPDQGATFRVVLPKTQPHEQQ